LHTRPKIDMPFEYNYTEENKKVKSRLERWLGVVVIKQVKKMDKICSNRKNKREVLKLHIQKKNW